tara:strand:+ start:183 stop:431 length:249 start_codon:yes stop_codon:yes gene_type:complete
MDLFGKKRKKLQGKINRERYARAGSELGVLGQGKKLTPEVDLRIQKRMKFHNIRLQDDLNKLYDTWSTTEGIRFKNKQKYRF